MRKILILSCYTGQGHNSAAEAIARAAERYGLDAEVADPVSFAGSRAQAATSAIYNNMIQKAPALFGAIYGIGALYSATKLPSPVYFANSLYAKKLAAYITEHNFEAVICTHLYGMEAMTAAFHKLGLKIPCYGVLTDYTCIPFFAETSLTGYFIPHQDLAAEMCRKGIPAEKLFPTGIPVDEKFTVPTEKSVARQALSIPLEKKVYLIMTGGVGCGNITALCENLIQNLSGDYLIYVLTGKNDKLCRNLRRRYRENANLQAVPFTKDVNLYMRAADVLLSKPGGLSSTEAAVVNLPLVHIQTIPGCETKNAAFFSGHGMSVCTSAPKAAAKAAKVLAEDEKAAWQMCLMQRKNSNPDAAETIIRQVANNASH